MAEAGAAATAADPGLEEVEAPALVAVRAQFLLIGAVRLVLAAAGLAAAIAPGTSAGVAVGLFGLGAGVLLLAVVGGRGSGAWERLNQAQALPAGARIESRGRSVARAAYPSTIGLSVLIVLALAIDSALAAVLAGILAGIGGVAIGFALQLAVWEQRRRARVFAEPQRGGRVYEAPR